MTRTDALLESIAWSLLSIAESLDEEKDERSARGGEQAFSRKAGRTVSRELDRLAEYVAQMTARPWVADDGDDSDFGFISGSVATIAQTWGKHEEDFPNAEANRAGIVALRNVADELIAVARSADGLTFTPGIEELRPLRNALHALHAKLAEGGKTQEGAL